MASIYIKHPLNSQKAIKINIALRNFVSKDSEGDEKWFIEVGTLNKDSFNNNIDPVYINDVNFENIEDAVNDAITQICSKVKWEEVEVDRCSPYISFFSHSGYVNIHDKIIFNIKDDIPSAGIDISNISIILNNGEVNFDITDRFNIYGDPFEYKFVWKPLILEG